MPAKAKKTEIQNLDNLEACVHLKTLNQVSNSMQPLCECVKRDLILGKLAGICSVCSLYKKSSDKIISEMYVSEYLNGEKILWDEEDFYDDVVKDKYSERGKFALEEDLSDDDDDDDDEEEQPKRRRKKRTKKKKDEEDDDVIIEKVEEEEKISEELFGGTDEDEDKELEVEDDTDEVEKDFQARKAKRRQDTPEEFDDVGFDLKKELKNARGSGFEAPDIEITSDGKERCPYCLKEFGSVSRHISRCKKAPAGAAEALRAKLKKSKKKTSKKKTTKKKTSKK